MSHVGMLELLITIIDTDAARGASPWERHCGRV
jgi:hypothetical protein